MSEARTKPSRLVRQAAITVADLPTANNNSVTVSISGLPARGIIHRITVNFTADKVFPSVANSIDGLFVHRLGSAGTNTMTDAHAESLVFVGACDYQGGGLAGSASKYTATAGTGGDEDRFLRSVMITPASTGMGASVFNGTMIGVAYDIYGADAGVASTTKVLGPNATDATLHFTIISAGSDFQDPGGVLPSGTIIQKAWLEVEIEPCF